MHVLGEVPSLPSASISRPWYPGAFPAWSRCQETDCARASCSIRFPLSPSSAAACWAPELARCRSVSDMTLRAEVEEMVRSWGPRKSGLVMKRGGNRSEMGRSNISKVLGMAMMRREFHGVVVN